MNSKIPDELMVLSQALNLAVTESNRSWLAAATLTIVALCASSEVSGGLGLQNSFSGPNFFVALTLALAAVNWRLCVVHANLQETFLCFHRFLSDICADKILISNSVSLKDLAHRTISSAYSRVFPVLFAIEDAKKRESIMNFAKPLAEMVYLGTPLVGMSVGVIRVFVELKQSEPGFYLKLLIGFVVVVVLLQVLLSLLTIASARRVRQKLTSLMLNPN